jgi:hypothetical protein
MEIDTDDPALKLGCYWVKTGVGPQLKLAAQIPGMGVMQV